MLPIRFRLRGLMILVALVAVGLWVAMIISRISTLVTTLLSESGVVISPYFYVVLALSVLALVLITGGVLGLIIRTRAVLRASSRRPDRIPPNLRARRAT
jgi:hypothetical protein